MKRIIITLLVGLCGTSVFGQWNASNTPHLYNTNTGNVGIGTETPTAKLHVVGNLRITENLSAGQYITVDKDGAYRVALNGQADGYIVGRTDALESNFVIRSNGISYFNGGNVGIGTVAPDAKLTVKGTIHSEEVKVDLSVPGPDYVFEEDYDLPSLSEVASYIRQHKHLPDIPAAKEMEENGVKVGEMNMLLLKKVEELTLYVIELKEENEELRERVEELEGGE